MRTIYPKIIIVLVILTVAVVMNFRFETKSFKVPEPVVKKVFVIKKVYIQVPVQSDSTKSDSTIITLPKQPLVTPAPDMRKFRRSRNLHRGGYIS